MSEEGNNDDARFVHTNNNYNNDEDYDDCYIIVDGRNPIRRENDLEDDGLDGLNGTEQYDSNGTLIPIQTNRPITTPQQPRTNLNTSSSRDSDGGFQYLLEFCLPVERNVLSSSSTARNIIKRLDPMAINKKTQNVIGYFYYIFLIKVLYLANVYICFVGYLFLIVFIFVYFLKVIKNCFNIISSCLSN